MDCWIFMQVRKRPFHLLPVPRIVCGDKPEHIAQFQFNEWGYGDGNPPVTNIGIERTIKEVKQAPEL